MGDGKLLIFAGFLIAGCVKPFDSPNRPIDTTLLVVDGMFIAGDSSSFRLSRAHSLSDTSIAAPVDNATLRIESRQGEDLIFTNRGNGNYHLDKNTVPLGSSYRLLITTSDGKEYASDNVEMRRSPEIDSLQWDQQKDVFIYLKMHDISNSTRYYKWDFIETVEYHTAFDSHLDFAGDSLIFIEPEDYRYTCYNTFNSAEILIGSSSGLSSDVISHQQITRVANDNSRIGVRYSILVRQYALTAEAYLYWNLVRQNSEQIGGLFDPQPAQLKSNIHNLDSPDELVLGYFSASSLTSKRLFIRNSELTERKPLVEDEICRGVPISDFDSIPILQRIQPYLPAYYSGGGTLVIAPAFCVDCRLRGGVTTKPDFW